MSSVWGFFYGGLINPAMMARVGLVPSARAVATLQGYDLRIAPWVNLVPSARDLVYGLLLEVSHDQLSAVYAQLKATYLPYPVLAHDDESCPRPALCYMVPDMPEAAAEDAHVRTLLEAAEAIGFPDWYLMRIRSFLPPASLSE